MEHRVQEPLETKLVIELNEEYMPVHLPHSRGIIVGANERSAWLLPWWWNYYRQHNSYPVTFVDFGLSKKSADWCKERGQLTQLKISSSFIAPQEKIDRKKALEWENIYGKTVWQARQGWFYKPFAMLLSPYETTIWTDLDCEICGSLTPLFDHLTPPHTLSIAPDTDRQGIYNTGVIVFKKASPLIQAWAQKCRRSTHQFLGDECVLSSLINLQKYPIQKLPQAYHTIPGPDLDPSALVIHWVANWGKMWIELFGGMQGYQAHIKQASTANILD